MKIGWKVLIPFAVLNIVFAGGEYALYQNLDWYLFYPVSWLIMALMTIFCFKLIKNFDRFSQSKILEEGIE